ncbi:VOC family protein [Rhizobiaceae bacterium n13]|uniref:VOC family protein n=1 Tax=Ferirhizobium litorale TaxID=2927786 RepID=A0AAE3U1Z8_9HYPH|nr:VOC family protein [Fererhizobium litorale]MDI7863260.1 VOC family protein [Fererhizobium litorale]MDI7923006.1 VOC family protein [Fererhizobium litorale]
MTTSRHTLRALDHLVLPAVDVETARKRLSALGFTVAGDARHPFGTENACVFLADGTYLEPLAIASREECEEAARSGNVFVARDQAYRFRRGQDGFSAVVVTTDDAGADDAAYRENGISGGEMLEFARPARTADGAEVIARFRLAFAADLRAPDFFLFACQRLNPLPADRAALETHENGAIGITEVVLSEPNPTDFQYLLQEVFCQREVNAHSFGMDIMSENVKISVLNPQGMQGFFGMRTSTHARGLRGRAIVFTVGNLAVTEAFLAGNGVAFERIGSRIVVAPAPGQGAAFAFEEQA